MPQRAARTTSWLVGGWICWLVVVGCGSELIAENLTERQANALVALMETHQIPAQRELDDQQQGRDRRWRLIVPAQEAPSARAVLTAYGLPQPDPEAATQPEAAQSQWPPQLFPVDGQSQAQQKQLKQDLERTLSELPGVLLARVHLNLSSVQPSAAVLLRTAPLGDTAREQLAEQVRALLVGAAQPLRAEHVQISLHPPTPEQPAVPLAKLGPWLVARGSLGTLRWALVGLTVGMVALGGALLWALRKKQQLQILLNVNGPSIIEQQADIEGEYDDEEVQQADAESGDDEAVQNDFSNAQDYLESNSADNNSADNNLADDGFIEQSDEASQASTSQINMAEDETVRVDRGEAGEESLDLQDLDLKGHDRK